MGREKGGTGNGSMAFIARRYAINAALVAFLGRRKTEQFGGGRLDKAGGRHRGVGPVASKC